MTEATAPVLVPLKTLVTVVVLVFWAWAAPLSPTIAAIAKMDMRIASPPHSSLRRTDGRLESMTPNPGREQSRRGRP